MFRPSRLWFSLLLATACDCGEGPAVDGPHPYVRCGEREPREGTWSAGALRFEAEDRTLRVEGLDRFVALTAVDIVGADVLPADLPVLVLGGTTTPGLLEGLGARAVFLVPGGDDDAEAYDALLSELDGAARDRVIDLAGVHELVTPHGRFVVLPGAPEGRYARGEASCGFGAPDVEARASERDGTTWLLAWAAPSTTGLHGVDRGLGGVHVGAPLVRELAGSVGARGGLFAFPTSTAGLAATLDGDTPIANDAWSPELAVTVPQLGAPTGRFDEGVLTQSHLVIELGERGLRVVSEAP
ncbi:MAG: hypothetical protein MUE69_06475 [Myxococcota bacterium]|jgi:hypothetical protein|nr:hypothetical protein [Myxococcota bacterium]